MRSTRHLDSTILSEPRRLKQRWLANTQVRGGTRDFKQPRFGKSPDKPNFIARKVDLLFTSIACTPDRTPARSLRHYLTEERTDTARCLSKQAIVSLEPKVAVIWRPNDNSRSVKS